MTTQVIKLLLLEDNPGDIALIESMLNIPDARWSKRFEVISANSLSEGLMMLADRSFDLVLADLSLPDSYGLETISAILKSNMNVPIIVLTGTEDETIGLQSVQQGAQDYLIKGQIDTQVLVRSINYSIERANLFASFRKSEERYALAVRGAKDGLWDWDIANDSIYTSPRCRSMLGYTNEELVDQPDIWFELVHPEDRPRIQLELKAHLKGQSPHFEHEHRMRQKNGNYCWILTRGIAVRDEAGKAYRMAGTMTDISGRKNAELAVIQLAAIVNSSDDAIISKNLTGNITSWNHGAEKIYGYSAQEIVGKHISVLYPPELIDEERKIVQRIESGEEIEHFETIRLRKDGERINVLITISPIRDATNTIIGASSISKDISERKRAEEERVELLAREKQAREELERANCAKDNFLAVLSHELRSPLSAILGWTTLLNKGMADPAFTAQGLETIERLARSQTHLIDDLLDISRIIAGKIKIENRPVELVSVIQDAIDVVRPAAETKSIKIEFLSKASTVLGDRNRLQQVVWNLLSNAVKFTPSNGTIRVDLDRIETNAVIRVIDSGKGIRPEFLPYVFDRFRQEDETSSRANNGLGLGLSIVRHVVELHRGAIIAESAGEGLGSTFTIKLPLLNPTTFKPLELERKPVQRFPSLAQYKILVVDDDIYTLELLTMLLRQCGAEVKACSTTAEAFDTLQYWRPSILVSDICMPGEDGYSLISKIRKLEAEQGGKIPAIALTGYAGIEDRNMAIASGFNMHIPKPVELPRLASAVETLAKIND
jgi:PAS domain S-box-containing protein